VVAFLRIGLGTFYALAKNEWVYILAIAAFSLFLLGSVCLYVIAYTGEKPQMNRLFAFMRKEQNDERD
jgi:cell division protein FtsW (lipid II flippase)